MESEETVALHLSNLPFLQHRFRLIRKSKRFNDIHRITRIYYKIELKRLNCVYIILYIIYIYICIIKDDFKLFKQLN